MNTLLKRPPNRHDLPNTLHRAAQELANPIKLLQIPPRELDDDVVQARLEACRRGLRDVVGDLVERDAEAELGGDEGEWVACGFGGEGRGSGETGVDLFNPSSVATFPKV